VAEAVRVLHHHEGDGWWAESPDVEGWSAAGDTYAEVVKLAEESVAFALKRQADLEHYVLSASEGRIHSLIKKISGITHDPRYQPPADQKG
jgi:predicted RNase H-like HicB family nuclease